MLKPPRGAGAGADAELPVDACIGPGTGSAGGRDDIEAGAAAEVPRGTAVGRPGLSGNDQSATGSVKAREMPASWLT